jgi:hypothetical protein
VIEDGANRTVRPAANGIPPWQARRQREDRARRQGWQAIGANHTVNLVLGPILCGRVRQHREEESLEDRDGLQARFL